MRHTHEARYGCLVINQCWQKHSKGAQVPRTGRGKRNESTKLVASRRQHWGQESDLVQSRARAGLEKALQ
jgi:hypothetical protein